MASRIDVFPQLFFPTSRLTRVRTSSSYDSKTAVSLQVESPKHFTFDPFVISG